LIDFDYDGKIFDMDAIVYSKEIGEDGIVKVKGLTKDSHIIAIDKHGNESKLTKIEYIGKKHNGWECIGNEIESGS